MHRYRRADRIHSDSRRMRPGDEKAYGRRQADTSARVVFLRNCKTCVPTAAAKWGVPIESDVQAASRKGAADCRTRRHPQR